MGDSTTLRDFHDALLRVVPDIDIEKHSCDICQPKEGSPMADGLNDADVQKMVDQAVAGLQAQITERDTKIAELTDKLAERETDEATAAAIADAVAPLNEKIGELQTALDNEVIARGKAETDLKELGDALEAKAAEDAKEARRADRIAAVKETGIFPEDAFDESVEVNKDRIDGWVDMDDSVFDQLIAGWKAAKAGGGSSGGKANGDLPTGRSAVTDALTDKADGKGVGKSGARGVMERSIFATASAGNDS